MIIPHLIKAGSTTILLGQINPQPPKVDCRVWAEDSYQEIVEILEEVRKKDIQRYVDGESSMLPQPLRKSIYEFLKENEK